MSTFHFVDAQDLLLLYPVPDETASEEQAERFRGDDLATATRQDLNRELTVLRLVNFVVDSAWHLGREVLVESELMSRRSPKR